MEKTSHHPSHSQGAQGPHPSDHRLRQGQDHHCPGPGAPGLRHNLRTCIIQFMKGDLYAGEWDGIKKMSCPIELIATGKGFCGIQGNPYPYREHRANAQEAVQLAQAKLASGQVDLLILDEINNALHLKLVDLEQVLELIRQKPPLVHLVLTGRDAHPLVIELADTVSEILEIKHAYRQGIEPQPGIDY